MKIISGEHRGRKLAKFNISHIRPTSEIVKSAIFSSIQFIIGGSDFLDLFGGTGSVGLEALSRGANSVFIIDNNADSIKLIKKNNELAGGNAQIIFASFDKAIQQFSKKNIKFDIIFLDPPFDSNLGEQAIDLIYKNNILKPEGIIIFEFRKDKILKLNDYCEIVKEKKYGIKKVVFISLNK